MQVRLSVAVGVVAAASLSEKSDAHASVTAACWRNIPLSAALISALMNENTHHLLQKWRSRRRRTAVMVARLCRAGACACFAVRLSI